MHSKINKCLLSTYYHMYNCLFLVFLLFFIWVLPATVLFMSRVGNKKICLTLKWWLIKHWQKLKTSQSYLTLSGNPRNKKINNLNYNNLITEIWGSKAHRELHENVFFFTSQLSSSSVSPLTLGFITQSNIKCYNSP